MKLTPEMDLVTAMITLCDRNVGAASVMNQLLGLMPPSAAWSYLKILDEAGVYGPSIWVIYKNRCGQEIVNFVRVLNGVFFKELTSEDLRIAAQRNYEIDSDALVQTKVDVYLRGSLL